MVKLMNKLRSWGGLITKWAKSWCTYNGGSNVCENFVLFSSATTLMEFSLTLKVHFAKSERYLSLACVNKIASFVDIQLIDSPSYLPTYPILYQIVCSLIGPSPASFHFFQIYSDNRNAILQPNSVEKLSIF